MAAADRSIRVIELAAGCFLAAVALITVAGVFMRYALGTALPDGYEFASLAQGVAVLWGLGLSVLQGRQITVDLLWEALSTRGKRRLDIVAESISLVFLIALTVMCVQRAAGSFGSGLGTSIFRVPVWPLHALAVAGLAAAVVLAAIRLSRIVRNRPA